MITYDIDELRALMGKLNTIEDVLESQKTQVVQIMDTYEEEMKIDPAWSSAASETNEQLVTKGREFYEDIYGEINQTLNRISRLNQSIVLFLASMSGLDEATIQRMGFVSPVGVDFKLSYAEIGQQDNATNFRYDPLSDNKLVRDQMYPGTQPELMYELSYHRNRNNPLLFDENGRTRGDAADVINKALAEKGYGGLTLSETNENLKGEVKEGQQPLPKDINDQIMKVLNEHHLAR